MFNQQLIEIVKLVLLFEISYSFKPPKHNAIYNFKTHNNAWLPNPLNHNTTYGFYVAGKTAYIDVPKHVSDVSAVIHWEVVNLDKDRLMFVAFGKAFMMVNQKDIKEMKIYATMSGAIIALGNNEALHIPTIDVWVIPGKPLPKPDRAWNYLELLSFNADDNSVSLTDYLPWSKDDDWKFISFWKMTDYIHFNNKLYLLIKRTLAIDLYPKLKEISIIRLCLDKGSKILSSATEIHYTRPEFQKFNEIYHVYFQLDISPQPIHFNERAILFVDVQTEVKSHFFSKHLINNFGQLFDEGARKCASGNGSTNVNLLRSYLREEKSECRQYTYKSCGEDKNFITTYDISKETGVLNVTVTEFEKTFVKWQDPDTLKWLDVLQIFSFPFPFQFNVLLYFPNDDMDKAFMCIEQHDNSCWYIFPNETRRTAHYFYRRMHINQHPLGVFLVSAHNRIKFYSLEEFCPKIKSCITCIMYAVDVCVWSNSICESVYEDEYQVSQSVNVCFKITKISPLILKASSKKLTIELDNQLDITNSQEHLVIKAGPNNSCTNIIITNKTIITCSMKIFKPGNFQIDVSLVNDNIANAIITAISTDKVNILMTQSEYNKVILAVIIILSLVIIYFTLKKSVDSHKTIDSSASSSTFDTSRLLFVKRYKSTKPSGELVKSWTTLPTVAHQLHLSKQSQSKQSQSKQSQSQSKY